MTDHSALFWLRNMNDPVGRLGRWAVYLQAYEFQIVYRKGAIHSNADALSRPVVESNLVTVVPEDDDVSQKTLDVYEDESQLYYLKYGKHMQGQSKKQVKRVEKQADRYSMSGDEIFIVMKDTKKKVPKIQDRDEIVLKAHLLGHFQVETTSKRIRLDFWWKGLEKDVERIVKRCRNCLENHRTAAKEHPALATEIREVGERVGIDLVFGLPMTNDGYVGICVITEYFTKFVFVSLIITPNKNNTF